MLTLLYALTTFVAVHATYSIIATDAKTRQVGGAGAECWNDTDHDVFNTVYVSVPNRTVLHTQGLVLPRDSPILIAAKDKMMNSSTSDDLHDILNTMKELDNYIWAPREWWTGEGIPTVDLRQYSIANFASSSAYTGERLTGLFAELYKDYDTEVYDVGGSVTTANGHSMIYHALGDLVSAGTVDFLVEGFSSSSSDDLAERLMTAMSSVIAGKAGDLRCLNADGSSTSATGAFLHVDNADGTEYLHLNIMGDFQSEPVQKLQEEFDEWKASVGNSGPSEAPTIPAAATCTDPKEILMDSDDAKLMFDNFLVSQVGTHNGNYCVYLGGDANLIVKKSNSRRNLRSLISCEGDLVWKSECTCDFDDGVTYSLILTNSGDLQVMDQHDDLVWTSDANRRLNSNHVVGGRHLNNCAAYAFGVSCDEKVAIWSLKWDNNENECVADEKKWESTGTQDGGTCTDSICDNQQAETDPPTETNPPTETDPPATNCNDDNVVQILLTNQDGPDDKKVIQANGVNTCVTTEQDGAIFRVIDVPQNNINNNIDCSGSFLFQKDCENHPRCGGAGRRLTNFNNCDLELQGDGNLLERCGTSLVWKANVSNTSQTGTTYKYALIRTNDGRIQIVGIDADNSCTKFAQKVKFRSNILWDQDDEGECCPS